MALSALLERARGAEPFPVTLNHHPAWWYQTQGRFQARMLASARALGMPVISADAWLDHVLAVRGSLAARDPRSGRLRVVAGGPDIAVLMPDASATPARVLGGLRYRVEAAQPGQSREWELPR
jgi:hypothetical protein